MNLFRNVRSPLESAIRAGKLIDMQRPPFNQFNRIINNNYAMLMTRAAYEACVQLPGERLKNDEIPASFRWGAFYLNFVQTFQERNDDSTEGVFDITVMKPDGFQVSKSVKVISDDHLEGKEGFVFLLPEETWPLDQNASA